MSLNLNGIKSDFIKYLIDNEKISEKELKNFDINTSIFQYLSEFSKFIQEKAGSLNLPKDFTGSISEILDLAMGNTDETNDLYSGYDDSEEGKNVDRTSKLETTFNKQELTKNVIKNNFDDSANLKSQEVTVYSITGDKKSKYFNETDKTGNIETKFQYEYTDNDNPTIYSGNNTTPDGKIDYSEQGEMGDCWLLSTLNSLSYTEQGKNILKNALTKNDDGSYTINFKGVNTSVRITQEELNYAKNSDKYAKGDDDTILFELGFESIIKKIQNGDIKIQGEHEGLTINTDREKNVLSGGNLEDAIFLLTGNDVKSVFKDTGKTTAEFNKVLNTLKENPGKYAAMLGISAPNNSDLTLKDINGKAICTLSAGKNHAFSIKSVDEDGVTITNPWDSSKEYKISFADAQKYSTGIQYYALDNDFKESKSAQINNDSPNSEETQAPAASNVPELNEGNNPSASGTPTGAQSSQETPTGAQNSPSTPTPSTTPNGDSPLPNNPNPNNPDTDNSSTVPKNIENMTLEELETAKNDKQGEVDKAKDNVNAVYSGENEAVKNAMDAEKTAKEKYDDLVNNNKNIDDKLKEERTQNLDDIEKKETEINKKKTDINNKEAEITKKESTISDIQSSIDALSSTISSLSGQKKPASEEGAAEYNAQIEEKIQAANAEKEQLEAQLKTEQENLEKLKGEKETLESELTTLETELGELEDAKTKIEEKILAALEGDKDAKAEMEKAMKDYNDARDNVKKAQTTEETKAKEALSTQQEELDAINKQIQDKKAEEIKEKYKVNSNGEINSELAQKIDAKLGNGFCNELSKLASEINCDPEDLLAMMYSESGLTPNIGGSGKATGLTQFLDIAAQAVGTTCDDLVKMSATEQLKYIGKYFQMTRGQGYAGLSADAKVDAGTLYAMNFLPASSSKEILCSKGDSAYSANSALDIDGDGHITKTDLAKRIENKKKEMYADFGVSYSG